MTIYRQGDVLLIRTEGGLQPPGARIDAGPHGATIALGEATGHHHTIPRGATLFRPDDMPASAGCTHVQVHEPAVLEHQEHDAIPLPPGLYLRAVQVEETPDVVQQVAD